MNRWLSDQGRFFVAVPNANAASRQIAVAMGMIDHNQAVTAGEHDHGHRRTYSMDTLNSHLQAAGLSVVNQGGVMFKGLANFQFDKALAAGIVDTAYLEGCFQLGRKYPDLCSSIYAICQRGQE